MRVIQGSLWIVLFLYLPSCGVDGLSGEPDAFVRAYKYDGSVQCEEGGIPLQEMAAELIAADVKILCAKKRHDGMVRIALCGEPTGNINVFEIAASDLSKAEELGFRPVTELSAFEDRPCS